jgi:PleD family two-component response regulator
VALNEEMSMQLRVERTYTAGITDFITVMIEQHETTAARLRAHLRTHQDAFAKPLTC